MPDHPPADDLARAAAEAVARSRAEADRLLAAVELLGMDLRSSADRLGKWHLTAGDPIDEFRRIADSLASGATRDFDHQLDGLETFNVVLFGRTGAGKSSLISAMARLDGARVSRGESDWTVEAAAVEWRGIRLFDTPGINGWGRSESRGVLEDRARDEVKKADVVLLCFDSQSQQATEFTKVAAWVKDFDKPVVAVLNNRNARWGLASEVASESQRRNLSLSVRQHVSNIQDNLTAIDLPRVPVIVISARRALDARAMDPFEGPDARGRTVRLEKYGEDRLLESSNLPVLEALLAAMVSTGAVELRLASLREGARSIYANTEVECSQALRDAESASEVCESTVEAALEVLGYPDLHEGRAAFRDERVASDLLTTLEDLRGEPLSAPETGSLDRHVASLIAAHLKVLETESIAAAEEAVKHAFDRGKKLSEDEFLRRVFDQPRIEKIEKAARTVQRHAAEYAESKLSLVARDGQADAEFVARTVRVDGEAGRGWGSLGDASRIGGLISAAAATIAATNFWNPGVLVGLGLAVVGGILSFLGGKAHKKAEREKLRARNDSLASARRAVRDSFKSLSDDLANEIAKDIWDRSTPSLKGQIQAAVGLRLLAREIRTLLERAGREKQAIPAKPDVARVMESALSYVLRERGRGSAAGILWGERWVGEASPASSAVTTAEGGVQPATGEILPDLGEVLAQSMTWPQLEQAFDWVERMRQREDLLEVQKIAKVLEVPVDPTLAVVGDYNAGKTTLIKRILVAHGRPVPPDLVVGARPTTTQSRQHDVGGLRLVDTPGFQSGDSAHEDEARKSAVEASALMLVFHPNLVIGDPQTLKGLLGGTNVSPAKLGHTFAVINRSDELGVDPTDSPDEYRRLCLRKRTELQQALASLGFEMSMDRILCVAADPFGLVGDSQGVHEADYRLHASWDRIDQLKGALDSLSGPLGDSARAVSLLASGCSRLMERSVECGELHAQAKAQETELARLSTVLQRAKNEANILQKDIAHSAEEIIRGEAQRMYDQLLAATDQAAIQARLEEFDRWYESAALREELERWASEAEERINRWARGTSSEVLREFRRRSFNLAFEGMPKVDLSNLGKDASGVKGMNLVHKGLGHLVMEFGKRDNVYRLGKALGYKFRPWEAVGTAKAVSKAGPMLAAIGVVLDAADWHSSVEAEKKREKARRSADDFFKQSVVAVLDHLLSTDNPDSPTSHLKAQMDELEAVLDSLAGEQDHLATTQQKLEFEISAIREILAEGTKLASGEPSRVGSKA